MTVFKAHGLGNDYLVWEGGRPLDAALVVALCDRHRGPGGDGVLEPIGPFEVRIWNPDGSIAEKSGNGLRIFAWWLHAMCGAPAAFSLDTGAAVVGCEVSGTVVAVEMGRAAVSEPRELAAAGASLTVVPVDVGNPHAVVFRDDADLDALPWRDWGRALEVHTDFPRRTNVQVARIVGPAAVELRVWERGAGETLASGSSACAVAAAAVAAGRVAVGAVEVSMPGGSLTVDVRSDLALRLVGPVAPVGRFTLHPSWRTS